MYYVYRIPGWKDNHPGMYAGCTNNPDRRKAKHMKLGKNVDQFKVIKRFFTKEEALAYEKHLHTVCNYDGRNISTCTPVTDILTGQTFGSLKEACSTLSLVYQNQLNYRFNKTSKYKNTDGTGDHTRLYFQWIDTKTGIKYRQLNQAVKAAGWSIGTVRTYRSHGKPTQFERIC